MHAQRFRFRLILVALSVSLVNAATAGSTPARYEPSPQPVSGHIAITGSHTQAYMAAAWGVEMKRLYPNLTYEMSMSGSSSAAPALLAGTTDIGFMSRRMKEKELAAFEAKYGYKPTELRVALDAISIYVHADNPIKGLTLAQVDAIYSTTRKCGYASDITTWGQAGLNGPWSDSEISLVGRTKESGTRELFAKKVLCRGEYKTSVKPRHNVIAVLSEVAAHKNAIAYSGAARAVKGARMLPVALKNGDPFVEPTKENIVSGRYPLSRYLYVYVNKAPGRPLTPAIREFLRFALSERGQEIVDNDGFIPLDGVLTQQELAKI